MQSTNECSVPECSKVVRARGWCYAHYMKVHRYGTPTPTHPSKRIDLTGMRQGTIVVVATAGVSSWRCVCDCGRESVIQTGTINRGQATCGNRTAHFRSDNVGYTAVHDRLRKDNGPAELHECVGCGQKAQHWSYNHTAGDKERTASSGCPYSLSPDDYSPRCVPCHKQYDLAVLRLTA